MSTGGNLGGASFKVTADAASFMKSMDDSEKKAKSATYEIATSFKEVDGAYALASTKIAQSNKVVERAMDSQVAAAVRATQAQQAIARALKDTAVAASAAVGGPGGGGGSGRGMGIASLAYAIDDLQYGFNAIVNNIPQIALGLGLGAGVAGAAGIAAVAINQLVKHWDDLSRLWGDDTATKLPELKTGIDGLTESIKEVEAQIASLQKTGKEGPNLWEIITGSGVEGQNKLNDLKAMSKEAREKLQAEQTVGGIEGTTEQDATGAAVKKAIRGSKGGVDALMDILTDRGMSSDDAKKAIAGALGGNEAHLDDILGKLTNKEKAGQFAGLVGAGQGARAASEQKRLDLEGGRNDRKNVEKLDKQAQKEKEDQAKLELDGRKRDKEMVHRLAENAKKERIQELEDQRDEIMKQKHAINEQFSPTQILSGAKSVVDMYQQAAGNMKRDQLLIQANKELQGIHQELKKSEG